MQRLRESAKAAYDAWNKSKKKFSQLPDTEIDRWENTAKAALKSCGIEIININDLKTSDAYQRNVDWSQVARIAKDYKPEAAGPLYVMRRNGGTPYVTDGRRRMEAKRKLGMEEIVCWVSDSVDEAHEAASFLLVNEGRKSIDSIGRFQARYTKGETSAIEIKRAVEAEGLRIPKTRVKGPPNIICVGALDKLHKRGGYEHVRHVLKILSLSWMPVLNGMPKGMIVDGLSWLLHRDTENRIDRNKFITCISPVTEGMLIERSAHEAVKAKSAGVLMTGARHRAVAFALLQIYAEKHIDCFDATKIDLSFSRQPKRRNTKRKKK